MDIRFILIEEGKKSIKAKNGKWVFSMIPIESAPTSTYHALTYMMTDKRKKKMK